MPRLVVNSRHLFIMSRSRWATSLDARVSPAFSITKRGALSRSLYGVVAVPVLPELADLVASKGRDRLGADEHGRSASPYFAPDGGKRMFDAAKGMLANPPRINRQNPSCGSCSPILIINGPGQVRIRLTRGPD